jgi:hypothetical protein
MDRKPPPAPVLEEVARRVREARPGTVFTPSRFDTVGDRAAINKSLQVLVEQEALRRLARGVFDKPRRHPEHGALWPTIGDIVEALTVDEGLCLLPTGDYAAKLFGPLDRFQKLYGKPLSGLRTLCFPRCSRGLPYTDEVASVART